LEYQQENRKIILKRFYTIISEIVRNLLAYRILVGKPEGKRPLEKPKRRWVDNIKMDLRKMGWDGLD
jgi:hypothetical protein